MKKVVLIFCLAHTILFSFTQGIISPASYLGYPLGSRFTPHYKIVDYCRQLAQSAPTQLHMEQYGESYEGRPLVLVFVSSPENIQHLDSVRLNNLRLAGMLNDKIKADENSPAVVWLSYNVHGNEPASSEAAMQTLYELLNPSNTKAKEWLKNTVVVVDPCINPDGRERYVNWYNSVVGKTSDPDPVSAEHREPWPGGRTNHYNFDLNRDWVWQTQVETRQRMKKYNEWLPQVHVDYHEQSYDEPYYFAPAAEPYHEVITAWQREFQVLIGKNNAALFDRNGWLYFTKETFDLFYPGYGDTYPMYNGAIGMTFEQGGISAGLSVRNADGDTLTLSDRLEHHVSTGLSTIEITSRHAERLVKEFHTYFLHAVANPAAGIQSYIIRKDVEGDRLERLKALLNSNGIQWSYVQAGNFSGLNYQTGINEPFKAGVGDIVVSANQPKSNLVRVLFERISRISDSATYDITAWSVPFVYGLDCFATNGMVNTGSGNIQIAQEASPDTTAYAYAVPWAGLRSARFLLSLLKQGIKVRNSELAFRSGKKDFEKGTLIIAHTGNKVLGNGFEKIIRAEAVKAGITLYPISSGLVDKGFDFGSERVHLIRKPRVALLTGNGVSSQGAGEIWHFFEQQLNYPLTRINADDLGQVKLDNYNVLILPDGEYRFLNEKGSSDHLKSWIQEGGKLIALERAVGQLAKGEFGIRRRIFPEDKKEEDKEKDNDKDIEKKDPYSFLHRYEKRQSDLLMSSTPGSIYKVDLDNSHPLGFGYPGYYYTLKEDDRVYEFLKEGGWNVGVIKKDNYVSGFSGSKAKDKIKDALIFGVQQMGRGQIVFLTDDPLFRSFWENGKLLFCNAVFLVGH